MHFQDSRIMPRYTLRKDESYLDRNSRVYAPSCQPDEIVMGVCDQECEEKSATSAPHPHLTTKKGYLNVSLIAMEICECLNHYGALHWYKYNCRIEHN